MADYNLAQASTLSPEDYAQQQQLNRQQQMAAMLMQQGMQQPQGQMVSGRYVPTSFFQNLVPLANLAASQYIGNKTDTKAAELAKQLREGRNTAEEKIIQQMTGTPAQATELAGPYTNKVPMPVGVQPAVAPDLAGALRDIRTNPYGAGKEYTPSILKQMMPETPSSVLEYKYAQQDPRFAEYQMGLKRASGTNLNVNTGQHGFDNALKLRTDFRNEPIYKGFEEVKSANNQIKQAAAMATPAGDLAAATKIMKILDPGSVVRESELGMAMAASGLEDRARNYANMVITGQKLTPTQRKDFTELGQQLYNVSAEQFNQKRNEYSGIAERNKLDVEAAVGAPAPINQGGWRIK
tara:strand:- start:1465 stop:2520 length:1056 start_codon:yes stop_codon:yes gene_type:complete